MDNLAEVDGGIVNDTLVGHGTLVAGSAAAIGNNGTGISGIGWNFGIMPIKVTNNNSGTAALSEILEGARWASDNGAYAANCSFGGAEDVATASTGGHIRLEGHLLVFAAGNDGLANQTRDWEDVTIKLRGQLGKLLTHRSRDRLHRTRRKHPINQPHRRILLHHRNKLFRSDHRGRFDACP